jgi:hypothetical protein
VCVGEEEGKGKGEEEYEWRRGQGCRRHASTSRCVTPPVCRSVVQAFRIALAPAAARL